MNKILAFIFPPCFCRQLQKSIRRSPKTTISAVPTRIFAQVSAKRRSDLDVNGGGLRNDHFSLLVRVPDRQSR